MKAPNPVEILSVPTRPLPSDLVDVWSFCWGSGNHSSVSPCLADHDDTWTILNLDTRTWTILGSFPKAKTNH